MGEEKDVFCGIGLKFEISGWTSELNIYLLALLARTYYTCKTMSTASSQIMDIERLTGSRFGKEYDKLYTVTLLI